MFYKSKRGKEKNVTKWNDKLQKNNKNIWVKKIMSKKVTDQSAQQVKNNASFMTRTSFNKINRYKWSLHQKISSSIQTTLIVRENYLEKNTKITAKLEAKEVLLKIWGQIDKDCTTQQLKWSTEKKLTRNLKTWQH